MRKTKRGLLFFVLVLCLLLSAVPAGAADNNPVNNEMVKSGWKTVGNKRYYIKKTGEAATGPTVIKKVRYLFGSGGADAACAEQRRRRKRVAAEPC